MRTITPLPAANCTYAGYISYICFVALFKSNERKMVSVM